MTVADPLYLDHHATTPVDPRVVDAMIPVFTEVFGNPSSIDHIHGAKANQLVSEAREQVAQLIRAPDADDIIFTSGATESDNLALRGVLQAGDHLITTAVEHKAILATCKELEAEGVEVTYLGVGADCLLSATDVEDAIQDNTKLVSIMAANNETGAIYPLAEIGAVCKARGVLFHTDAAQACGHIPIDVDAMSIDLLSLSGHKLYGPKGIGAIYIRAPGRHVKLHATTVGGGQERNLRSGTHNVPGIVGLGEAARIATKEQTSEAKRVAQVRDELWAAIQQAHAEAELIGPAFGEHRLPHNLMVSLKPYKARALLRTLKEHVSLSTGSACQTDRTESSHVLDAMGRGDDARYVLRFGLGRSTDAATVAVVSSALGDAIEPLRALA